MCFINYINIIYTIYLDNICIQFMVKILYEMSYGILKSEKYDHTLPCHEIALETPILNVIVTLYIWKYNIFIFQIQPITYVSRRSTDESQTWSEKALESKTHSCWRVINAKNVFTGTAEMAPPLGTLVLTEDLGSIFPIHMKVYNYL